MPRRGGIPAPWWPESPLPRRLTRTAGFAHALPDHVLREVGLAAHHAAPPANRPDHTRRPEIVVKHLLAPLASVPCPRLRFLKVMPEPLWFVNPRLGTPAGGISLGAGACARCAGAVRDLGVASRFGGAGSTGRALCLALRCIACRTLRPFLNPLGVFGVPCGEPSGLVGKCGHARRQTPLPVPRT